VQLLLAINEIRTRDLPFTRGCWTIAHAWIRGATSFRSTSFTAALSLLTEFPRRSCGQYRGSTFDLRGSRSSGTRRTRRDEEGRRGGGRKRGGQSCRSLLHAIRRGRYLGLNIHATLCFVPFLSRDHVFCLRGNPRR